MKREFSAGGIVVNKKGLILLVQNQSIKDHKINYWGFPKGHIEEGQTSKEAAIREVQEEGGVVAEILEKVGGTKYVYTRNDEKIFKIVTIYLMKYISGDPKDHDHEVNEAKWFTKKKALITLSFKRDQEILEKALTLLGTQF